MECEGVNGKLILGKNYIEIIRKGTVAFLTQGLKGNKKILLKQISAIQFKDATTWTRGYIQFSFIGGQESKRGLFNAAMDENTVLFDKKHQEAFDAFKEAVEEKVYI